MFAFALTMCILSYDKHYVYHRKEYTLLKLVEYLNCCRNANQMTIYPKNIVPNLTLIKKNKWN